MEHLPKIFQTLQFKQTIPIDKWFNCKKTETHDPYPWQIEFYRKFDENRLLFLTATTGAGKSNVIIYSALKWASFPNNKSIIVVPQKGIGNEFYIGQKIKFPDGTIKTFYGNNLCGTKEATSDALIDFIENDSINITDNELRENIIICCAPTIVSAYNKTKNNNKWSNILLVIDEAHHVSTNEDESGNYSPNELGNVFLDISKNLTNKILLVTATDWRTDRTTIVPTDLTEKLEKFTVPFYRVQDECRIFNKRIGFNYCVYDKSFIESLPKIFNENEKTVIFLHPNKSGKNKIKWVSEVISSLGDIVSEENGIIQIKTKSGKVLKFADLVTPKKQQLAQNYIKLVSKQTKSFDVDVILALNMFKEGQDYPPLQHCIIDGIRNSYGDIVQMIGRVTRDYENKFNCKVTQILPSNLNVEDGEMINELNNHLKVIASMMAMVNYFKPIYIRVKRNRTTNGSYTNLNPFEILGNESEQISFREKVILKFTKETIDNDEAKVSYDRRLNIMIDIIKKETNLSEDKCVELAEGILIEQSYSLKFKGNEICPDEIEFDFLKEIDTTDFLFSFQSDYLGSSDFKRFKSIVEGIKNIRTEEEHISLIKEKNIRSCRGWMKYHKENNLIRLGYYVNAWRSFGYMGAEWFCGIWEKNLRKNYNEDMIKEWAETHKKLHGEYPHQRSSETDCFPEEYKDLTWRKIAEGLINGNRGLNKGQSLSILLYGENLQLNEDLIKQWTENYKKIHRKYPTNEIKNSDGIPLEYKTTWLHISDALSGGHRGLKGNTSLTRLIYPLSNENINIELIKKWADEYKVSYGKYPNASSANSHHIPTEYNISSWNAIEQLLKKGSRGLPISTLSKIIHGDKLTGEEFLKELKIKLTEYKNINGKYPNHKDLSPLLSDGTSVSAVRNAFSKKLKGMEKFSYKNLSDFIKRELSKS